MPPKNATSNLLHAPKNSPSNRAALYLLIILTLALYVRLLGFDFVTWDDHTVIVNNPIVLSGFSNWDGLFDSETFARFMPLSWLSFKAISAFFGMDPAYFHASSVVLHLANTVLLYNLIHWLIRIRIRENRSIQKLSPAWPILLTTFLVLLWSWHPLRVEPVAWSTALHYNVSTFFFLCSLLSLVAYHQGQKPATAMATVVFLACSHATYPPAITWPIAIPIFWLFLRNDSLSWNTIRPDATKALRKCAPIFIPSLFIAGTFLSLTVSGRLAGKATWYSNGGSELSSSVQFGVVERLMNVLHSGSGLLQRMVLPLELSPAWPPEHIRAITLISTAVVILLIAVICFSSARRSPRPMLALLIIGIVALPVLGITEQSFHQPDRYAHFLQLIIVVVITLNLPLKPIASWMSKQPIPGIAILIVTALLLATVNFKQQGIWANSYTLFNHLESVSWVRQNQERMYQIQCLRARKLTSDKYYQAAAAIYEPLLRKNPDPFYVTYHASINYLLMGKIERARILAEEAARLDQREEIASLVEYLNSKSKQLASPDAESDNTRRQ